MATSKKPWGKIDGDGKLIGKPSAFPPTLGSGERLSYRNVIAHNSGVSPEKFFLKKESFFLSATCVATYVPSEPRGEWHVDAWGFSESGVMSTINETLEQLGLA
jgi:hypothetical protein